MTKEPVNLANPGLLEFRLLRGLGAGHAHEIQQDAISIEKAHLYYRPVFAFEFAWTTEDKVGVIEVDGLTGEVIENGQWFKEKMDTILTRDMLFEASAEIAGVIVPGGSFAVKVVERMTANK